MLFIYICLCWLFAAVWAFLYLWQVGCSVVVVRGFLTAVASFAAEHGLQDTQTSGDVVGRLNSCNSLALECRVNSCDSQVQQLHTMWDPPGKGSDSCLLHWQSESSSPSHQGSPAIDFLLSRYLTLFSHHICLAILLFVHNSIV